MHFRDDYFILAMFITMTVIYNTTPAPLIVFKNK